MVLVSFRSPSRCAKPLLPPGLHAAGAVLIGIVATYWLAVRAMGSPCSDWRRHYPAQIRSRELRLQALLRRGDVSGLKGGAREPEGQAQVHARSQPIEGPVSSNSGAQIDSVIQRANGRASDKSERTYSNGVLEVLNTYSLDS